MGMEGKKKNLRIDIKSLPWTTLSVAGALTKIENSRMGASLQKDHEFCLDLWM